MTSPAQAKKRSQYGPRTYAWPPQPPHEFEVVSVTSAISGGLPKPHLIGWAAKVVAEAAVDDHDLVTAMLAKKGGERMAIDHLKGARYRTTSEKADRGTVVHAAVDAYLAGKPFTKAQLEEQLRERRVPQEMWKSTAGMVAGAMEFLFELEPEVHWNEATVYSRTHGYAGTTDMICTMKVGGTRRPVIVDFKTSKAIYDDVALQLCAYGYADFVGLNDGTEAPLLPKGKGKLPITDGVVVRPMASGTFEAAAFTLTPALFETFLGCLAVTTGKGIVETSRRPSF